MEFKINNHKWRIEEKSKQELINMYNEQYEETYFVFGLTLRAKHLIYINKEMCKDQKIKTLKHELTHCYIWEYGLYNVPNFNEEMACDLVSSSNDFINEVVREYLEQNKPYIERLKERYKDDIIDALYSMETNNEYKSKH